MAFAGPYKPFWHRLAFSTNVDLVDLHINLDNTGSLKLRILVFLSLFSACNQLPQNMVANLGKSWPCFIMIPGIPVGKKSQPKTMAMKIIRSRVRLSRFSSLK
jgi:hypothetical protein